MSPRTVMLLEPAQAARVREIALTAPSGQVGPQLEDAGIADLVALPYRARLRLGEPPVRDVEHMNFRDFQASTRVGLVIYRKRQPACRECGRPIEPGHVIAFGLKPTRENVWGNPAFLHYPVCPSGDDGSDGS